MVSYTGYPSNIDNAYIPVNPESKTVPDVLPSKYIPPTLEHNE